MKCEVCLGFYLLAVLCITSVVSEKMGGCQQDAMAQCTDPLRVLTNNRDLGFATTKLELDSLCPNLLEGLRCIDNFTLRCLDNEHRHFFNMLYAGTKAVIVELCQNEAYQTEYLQHALCMREVQSGYEKCAAEYQDRIQGFNNPGDFNFGDEEVQGTTESSKNLCCSFQGYMNCSRDVVRSTCGQKTADFTKGFLDTMAGPLIQGYCLAYEADHNDCLPLENAASNATTSQVLTTTVKTAVTPNSARESQRRSDSAIKRGKNGAVSLSPLNYMVLIGAFHLAWFFV